MYIPHICGADVHFIIFDWELFDLITVYALLCVICTSYFLGFSVGSWKSWKTSGLRETERRQAGLHTAEAPEISAGHLRVGSGWMRKNRHVFFRDIDGK